MTFWRFGWVGFSVGFHGVFFGLVGGFSFFFFHVFFICNFLFLLVGLYMKFYPFF